MSSEQKIAANGRNAQRSTGPKSAAGKRVSRQNAVRDGIFARLPLLDSEDTEEYDAQRAGWFDDFAPVDHYEKFLVSQMVDREWQVRRLDLAYRAGLEKVMSDQFSRLLRSLSDREFKLLKVNIGELVLGEGPVAIEQKGEVEVSEPANNRGYDAEIERARRSLNPQAVKTRLKHQIDRVLNVGQMLLAAISSNENVVPIAEIDRLKRAAMRDLIRLRAELERSQARRVTIDAK